jgi:hypothetical protein
MARKGDNKQMAETNRKIAEAHRDFQASVKSVGSPDRIADSTTGQESAPQHD